MESFTEQYYGRHLIVSATCIIIGENLSKVGWVLLGMSFYDEL